MLGTPNVKLDTSKRSGAESYARRGGEKNMVACWRMVVANLPSQVSATAGIVQVPPTQV